MIKGWKICGIYDYIFIFNIFEKCISKFLLVYPAEYISIVECTFKDWYKNSNGPKLKTLYLAKPT